MVENGLLRAERLGYRYSRQPAVEDASFEVGHGEILGLLGQNGAGKTTTLRMLAGVLRPHTGRVLLDGEPLYANPRRKSRIGYLPDAPPLYPELTVGENLRYAAKLRAVAAGALDSRVSETLQRCGLSEHRSQLAGHLSKGFQQRLGLAQAIVHQPALVILDEPTIGLDPLQLRAMRDLIKTLAASCSVIFSSHLLAEVQAVCERVLVLDRGRIVLSQRLAELGHQSALTVCFTRPPSAERLARLVGAERLCRLGEGRFLISHPNTSALAPKLVETSVREGWGLCELGRERTSLEELFVTLVTADPAAGGPPT